MKEQNNRVWNILNSIGQLIMASILWGFCCLPVFTIGASCTALYYCVVKVVRRDVGTAVWTEFFRAFKQNFTQGLLLNVIFLGLTAVVSMLAVPHIQTLTVAHSPDVMLYICFGLLLLYGWMPIFAYPCLSRFEFSIKQIFMWTLYAGIKNIGKTLGLLVLFAVTAVFSAYEPVFLIITPGLFSFISSFVLEPTLKECSSDDGSGNYSKWY